MFDRHFYFVVVFSFPVYVVSVCTFFSLSRVFLICVRSASSHCVHQTCCMMHRTRVANILNDHPSYLCCTDALRLVGDPLSGNGCGSPNQFISFFLLVLFTQFILDIK